MVEKKQNEIKTVSWLLVAKNLIKFANDEATYPLADNVVKVSNFEKFPLRKGDSVEVEIKEGKVTYLRKSSSPKTEGKGSEEAYEPTPEEEKPRTKEEPKVETTKKEEPKAEAPKVVNTTPFPASQELTVFAVATNKKVVKFTELKDDGWYQISEDIQKLDYANIGLIARTRVRVTLDDKTVTGITKVQAAENSVKTEEASQKTETTTSSYKKPYNPNYAQEQSERQTSIEAQAAINSANHVVGRIAANIDPKPTASVLNSMIRAIAEENYRLIQELKKK